MGGGCRAGWNEMGCDGLAWDRTGGVGTEVQDPGRRRNGFGMQFFIARYCTVRNGMVRCAIVVGCAIERCGASWCIAMRCGAVRCSAVRCALVRCVALHCGVERYGAVRFRCDAG